jgi:hypothetical protein
MGRTVVIAGVSVVLTLAVVAAAGLLFASSVIGPGAAFAAMGSAGPWAHRWGPNGHGMPEAFKVLADIPSEERFQHLQGFELRLTDKDDKPFNVAARAGTVGSISGSSLVLDANDGSEVTYALNADTVFHGQASSAADLQAGDTVLVAAINGSSAATAVVEVPGDGTGFHGRWGEGHGPWGAGGQ